MSMRTRPFPLEERARSPPSLRLSLLTEAQRHDPTASSSADIATHMRGTGLLFVSQSAVAFKHSAYIQVRTPELSMMALAAAGNAEALTM